MPYVSRDGANKVNGLYAVPQPGYATELLADGDPEVNGYLNPPPTPEQVRLQDIDSNVAGATIGASPAITFAQAKAMTFAQWNTWWGNNVTTAAQAIVALKWIALIVIRKVL